MTKQQPARSGAGPAGLAASVLAMAGVMVSYHEGYIPNTYRDPVGIPTICYGHTGPDVTPDRVATREECMALLDGDLLVAWRGVQRCIHDPIEPHQAAALVSFTFNVGVNAMCSSTLARKANAGDWTGACAELSRWVYAKGIRLPGLVKRRADERAMCEGRA